MDTGWSGSPTGGQAARNRPDWVMFALFALLVVIMWPLGIWRLTCGVVVVALLMLRAIAGLVRERIAAQKEGEQ